MIEKFKFKKIIFSLLILLSSVVQLEAREINLPNLKFESCLLYPVCEFRILPESKEAAIQAGFTHDKLVIRIEPLVHMSYLRECTKSLPGIGDFRQVIWIDFATKMSGAERITAKGKKFRGMLLGDITVDNQRSKDAVIRLIANFCSAGGV